MNNVGTKNMNTNKNIQVIAAQANYKGFTLKLDKSAKTGKPVILVINHRYTARPDGVLDVVMDPRTAKSTVDRRIKAMEKSKAKERRKAARKDAETILATHDGAALAMAMMGA